MKDTRTKADNAAWWLRMADRYEQEASKQKTLAKQADYQKRADAARLTAASY